MAIPFFKCLSRLPCLKYTVNFVCYIPLTWSPVLITVIFIYPIPYNSRIKHSRIYPTSWLSLWSVCYDSTTRIPVAHCRGGQQSKRSAQPGHALLNSVIAVLPFAELFYEVDVGLSVVGFYKPLRCSRKRSYLKGQNRSP